MPAACKLPICGLDGWQYPPREAATTLSERVHHLAAVDDITAASLFDATLLLLLRGVWLQMDRTAMVGVLSVKDVVRILFEDQKHEIDSLKDYIHGGW